MIICATCAMVPALGIAEEMQAKITMDIQVKQSTLSGGINNKNKFKCSEVNNSKICVFENVRRN